MPFASRDFELLLMQKRFGVFSQNVLVAGFALAVAHFLFNDAEASAKFTTASAQFYVVKENDSLSNILWALGLGPLYGNEGFVKRVAECNELKASGRLIQAGDVLKLSYKVEPSVRDFVSVSASGEILIDRKWLLSRKKKSYFAKYFSRHGAEFSNKFGERDWSIAVVSSENTAATACSIAADSTAESLAVKQDRRESVNLPEVVLMSAYGLPASTPQPSDPVSSTQSRTMPDDVLSETAIAPQSVEKKTIVLPEEKRVARNALFQWSHFDAKSRHGLGIQTGFQKIEVLSLRNGSTAVLLSKSIFGADGEWNLAWSPYFSTNWTLRALRISLFPPASGQLQNASQTFFYQRLSLDFGTPLLAVSLFSGYAQTPVVRALSEGVAVVDPVPAVAAGLGARLSILRVGSFWVSVLGESAWGVPLFSGGTSIKKSSATLGGVEILQQFDRFRVSLGTHYRREKVHVSTLEQTTQELLTRVGLSLDLCGTSSSAAGIGGIAKLGEGANSLGEGGALQ